MRKIAYFIAFLISLQSFGQEIKSELIKTIDSEFHQSIIDVEIHDNKLYLLAAFHGENQSRKKYYVALYDLKGNKLKQQQIDLAFAYFDLVVTNDGSFVTLGTKDGEGMEMIDFVSFYDNSLNNISNATLETKNEGFLSGFVNGNEIIIGTNNNMDYVLYKFDSSGNKLDQKSLNNGMAETLESVVQSDNGLILYGWSMKVWQQSRADLIKLNENFEIVDSITIPFTKKVPVRHKLLENSESILIWDSIAPVSMFFDTKMQLKKSLCYIRHDVKLLDVCNYNSDQLLYSGKLGDKSAIFLTQGKKILEKVSFEKLGIWGKNRLFKLNDNEFIFVTDAIRTNDFDTKIQIYRVNKK